MAVFKDTTITDAGKRLLAQALANRKQITFTKLETSDFDYEENNNIEEVINLNQVKQSINLSGIVQKGTFVTVKGVFTNRGLVNSYEIKTIGCFAKINDENEILYSITRVKTPDTMPAENGINLSTIEIELVTQINNESGAVIKYSPDALVTKSTLATETEAGIITLNQIKGLMPTIPEASESQAGLVTLAKIKEISPKADLSNYVTFNKGYRVTDSTNWVIRSSLAETWMPHQALMFNESGNYTGTFHLNGSRAYYKVPNRNSNNWCEIMDNFDRDNLQNQINAHLNGYQFNKNTTGYCKFPNGFIIQWGWGTTNTPTNFPIAFPNACLRIIGTQNGYSEIYENIKIMDGWTNYNFRMKLLDDQTFYFHYIAIGY